VEAREWGRLWVRENSQLRSQLKVASPSFFLLLRYHGAGVSEEGALGLCQYVA